MVRWIGIAVLFVLAGVLAIFAGWEYFQLNRANSEVASMRAELLVARTEAENLEVVSSLSKDVIDQLGQSNEEYLSLIEGVTSEMKAQEIGHERAMREFEERFMCSAANFSPDYETNHSVSETLLEYVSDINSQSVAVSANYWKIFWTGTKFSHHTVEAFDRSANRVYLWDFIVFYEGESSGEHVNGIFWADQQCWLDLSR